MRIAIITFHHVYNFGGVLQALALQTYLRGKGHEVKIIDYRPQYLESEYRVWKSPLQAVLLRNRELKREKVGFLKRAKSVFRCFAGTLKQNMQIHRRIRKKKVFELFIKKHLSLTQMYTEKTICGFDSDAFDLYVCGSDQIWNKKITGGKYDPTFFFSFLDEGVRKNSYSASSGDSMCLSDQELRSYLDSFENISVRESKDQQILQEILQKEVYQTIDPTLLLRAEDYSCFESQCETREPYIFVYLLERNSQFLEVLNWVKARIGIERVMDLSPTAYFSCEGLDRKAVGPGEFLAYIKNASFVLTNSFHGTAFSIIYHKQFFTFPHSQRASRMVDLLKKLNLQNRIVNQESVIWSEIEQVDFYLVDEKRHMLILENEKYTDRLLSNG